MCARALSACQPWPWVGPLLEAVPTPLCSPFLRCSAPSPGRPWPPTASLCSRSAGHKAVACGCCPSAGRPSLPGAAVWALGCPCVFVSLSEDFSSGVSLCSCNRPLQSVSSMDKGSIFSSRRIPCHPRCSGQQEGLEWLMEAGGGTPGALCSVGPSLPEPLHRGPLCPWCGERSAGRCWPTA